MINLYEYFYDQTNKAHIKGFYYCMEQNRSKYANEFSTVLTNSLNPKHEMISNRNSIDYPFVKLRKKEHNLHTIDFSTISVQLPSNLRPSKKVQLKPKYDRITKNSQPVLLQPRSFIFPKINNSEAEPLLKSPVKQRSKSTKKQMKLNSSQSYRQSLQFLQKKKPLSNKISLIFEQEKQSDQKIYSLPKPKPHYFHSKDQLKTAQSPKKRLQTKRFKTQKDVEQNQKHILAFNFEMGQK